MIKTSSGQLGRGVSIVGIGCTPCGDIMEHEPIKHLTEGELLAAAAIEAVEDAGIEFKDIDAYLVGSLGPQFTSNVANHAAIWSKWLGMMGMPGISHDECCCTSNYGLQTAVMMVASGVHNIILNTAVNVSRSYVPMGKPRLPQFAKRDGANMGDPAAWTNEPNFGHPGKGGIMDALDDAITLYARKYGYTREKVTEAFNAIHIMGRHQALSNPLTLIRTESYEEEAAKAGFGNAYDYLNDPILNPRIGTLLRLRDINPMADGAAATIIMPTEMAKRICDHPIEISGFGAANLWMSDYNSIPISADKASAQQAYSMAGIADPSREIDVLALHDCTVGNWLTFSEDVGYFGSGEALEAAISGDMAIDGSKPVNIHGGRQEFGHPLGPCNMYDMYDIIKQMRGQAEGRKMKKTPTTAAIQGYAGSFSYTMTVLRSL
jgi:acetyl-CoA C-acetyltransferase